MKKFIKVIGIVIGVIVGLAVLAWAVHFGFFLYGYKKSADFTKSTVHMVLNGRDLYIPGKYFSLIPSYTPIRNASYSANFKYPEMELLVGNDANKYSGKDLNKIRITFRSPKHHQSLDEMYNSRFKQKHWVLNREGEDLIQCSKGGVNEEGKEVNEYGNTRTCEGYFIHSSLLISVYSKKEFFDKWPQLKNDAVKVIEFFKEPKSYDTEIAVSK